jgi:ketosteroid isomerase-like protein
MEHPNATIVRKLLEALPADMETVDALTADDIIWRSAGRTAFSGEYRGKGHLFDHFATIGRMLGSADVEHRVDMHDVLANDEHTVVLWTRHARRGTESLDVDGVGVFHLRDGKISEWWVVHADQHAFDEFFSPAAGV